MSQPFIVIRCDARVGTLRLQVQEELDAPWTVIFGPSGSGKSSLLRLIAGLWQPHGSTVRLHSQDLSLLPAHRRRVTLVSQVPSLFPHLTVRGNISFGAHTSVDPWLELLDLQAVASTNIQKLSGGESQRVAIARALATQPRLLLLDESFTGMHRALRRHLTVLLQRVQHQRAAAGEPMHILSVTHDAFEAASCADDVLKMEGGSIVARGPAEQMLGPERTELLAENWARLP